MTVEEAYRKGFVDGLQTFAWWKDGVEYVGTCGTTLREAITNVLGLWNYLPPGKGD